MPSTYIRPFDIKGATVNLAVLTTTANVAVTRPNIGTQSIRLVNVGTNTVFVTIGTSGVTASLTTSFPLLPNTAETFLLQNGATHVAAIASATGNTLYVTTGESA